MKKKNQNIKRDRELRKGFKREPKERDDSDPEEEQFLLNRCHSLEDVRSNKNKSASLGCVKLNTIDANTPRSKSVDDILLDLTEVKETMLRNAIKIRDRHGKLDDLMEKGTQLNQSTEMFQKVSKTAARRLWWKARKRQIIFIVLCAVAAVIVMTIIAVILMLQNNNTETHNQTLKEIRVEETTTSTR